MAGLAASGTLVGGLADAGSEDAARVVLGIAGDGAIDEWWTIVVRFICINDCRLAGAGVVASRKRRG